LAKRTTLAEGVHAKAARPVLHGDNGATLKATTVLVMPHWLGIKPSYSRPRVSDDNAFVEALFRTAKSIGRSSRPEGSPSWTPPGKGWRASCAGTTTSIATAAFAMSRRDSVMPVKIAAC
jgi:transposase InsO family protein